MYYNSGNFEGVGEMIEKIEKAQQLLDTAKSEVIVQELCNLYNILEFQAEQLIRMYRNLERLEYYNKRDGLSVSDIEKQKWDIIFGLVNGDYSQEEWVRRDLQVEIIYLLQGNLTLEKFYKLNKLCDTGMNSKIMYYILSDYKKEESMSYLDDDAWRERKYNMIKSLFDIAWANISNTRLNK